MNKDKMNILVRIEKTVVNQCDTSLELANVRSRNELICEAIDFYLYYLHHEQDGEYLAPSVKRIMSRYMAETENKIAGEIYRMAIEQKMMLKLLAEEFGYDDDRIQQLRQQCVDEVNRINGTL